MCNPTSGRNALFHVPKDQKCEIWKLTKTTLPMRKKKPAKLPESLRSPKKIGELTNADHRNALIVQDLCSNWIQNYLAKYKNSAKTLRCLQRFVPHTQTSGRIYTENSLDFIQACQDLQWTHDTFAHIGQKTDNLSEE